MNKRMVPIQILKPRQNPILAPQPLIPQPVRQRLHRRGSIGRRRRLHGSGGGESRFRRNTGAEMKRTGKFGGKGGTGAEKMRKNGAGGIREVEVAGGEAEEGGGGDGGGF